MAESTENQVMDLPLEVIGDLAESRFCTITGEEALSQGAKE